MENSTACPLGILYVAIALLVSVRYLPVASLQPLAPVGQDPVREVDILSLAAATGRVATPFAWGSYVAWRLYPSVRDLDGWPIRKRLSRIDLRSKQ